MAAPRCAGARHTLRSAPGAPALVRPAPDPRQHHGHHRAQAQRIARGRRTTGLRADHRATSTSPRRSRRSRRPPNRSRPMPLCTVSIYDAGANVLHHVAGTTPARRIPRGELVDVEIGPRNGSCAAAIFLQRQVVVAEIARDALWEHLREPGARGGSARLLVDADPRVGRPDARDRRAVLPPAAQPAEARLRADGRGSPRSPASQSSASAPRRRCAAARRATAACSRTSSKASTASTVDGRFESVNPALVQMLGYERRRRAAGDALDRATSTPTRRPRPVIAALHATASCATPSTSCDGATAR